MRIPASFAKHLTLRVRLWFGFSMMILLAIAGGLTSSILARQAADSTAGLIAGPIAIQDAAEQASIAMLQSRRSEKDFLARRDTKYLDKVDAAVAQVDTQLDMIRDIARDPSNVKMADEAKSQLAAYHNAFKEMAQLTIERGLSEEEGLEGQLRKAVHTVEDGLKNSGHDRLTVLMLMCRRHEKDYLMRGNPKYIGRIDDRLGEFTAAVEQLGINEQTVSQWDANWKVYRDAMGRLLEIDQRQEEVIERFREATHQVEEKLNSIMAAAAEQTPVAEKAVNDKLALSQHIAWTVIGITLLTGLALSVVLIHSIARPIKAVAERAAEIAEGDLRATPLTAQTEDELGRLTVAINMMQNSLNDLVGAIKQSSSEVAAASTEIAASAEQTATGMDEQSRQVQQAAEAVRQLSESINEVANQSTSAAECATVSGQAALKGSDVVNQAVRNMQQINEAVSESSQAVTRLGERGEQIGQVINVINDIADQTNLLALNAAIEAARAGEHGRGFAVVADEVRKLADRTTQATEEVGDSIKAIQDDTTSAVQRMEEGTTRVAAGVESTTSAGQSLADIRDSASRVESMVRQIAAAAEQQSSVSNEISDSIQRINAVTREASEAANQAAEAVNGLSQKSESLRQLTERFKVNPIA